MSARPISWCVFPKRASSWTKLTPLSNCNVSWHSIENILQPFKAMPFLVYLLLLVLFLLSGLGILQLFGFRLKPVYTITLSLLLGVALASFLPFVLQLCY